MPDLLIKVLIWSGAVILAVGALFVVYDTFRIRRINRQMHRPHRIERIISRVQDPDE